MNSAHTERWTSAKATFGKWINLRKVVNLRNKINLAYLRTVRTKKEGEDAFIHSQTVYAGILLLTRHCLLQTIYAGTVPRESGIGPKCVLLNFIITLH